MTCGFRSGHICFSLFLLIRVTLWEHEWHLWPQRAAGMCSHAANNQCHILFCRATTLLKWGPSEIVNLVPLITELWSLRQKGEKFLFSTTGSQRKRWKAVLITGHQTASANNNNKEEKDSETGWKGLLHICQTRLVWSLAAGMSHMTPTVTKQKVTAQR